MTNEPMELTTSARSQPRSRTRRSRDQRASDLLKKQKRLVDERVGEILEIDPEMISLRSEQKKVARQLHVIRLNLTKKSQKVERLSRLVSKLLEELKGFHGTERELAEKIAKNSGIRQLKEQKVTISVARAMGFPGIGNETLPATEDLLQKSSQSISQHP